MAKKKFTSWISKSKREEHFEISTAADIYRKIPKISPGAYIFQRPFLGGLFLERLNYIGRGLYTQGCQRVLK